MDEVWDLNESVPENFSTYCFTSSSNVAENGITCTYRDSLRLWERLVYTRVI